MRRALAAAAAGVVVALSFAPLSAGSAQAQANGVSVSSAPLTMSPAPDGNGTVTTNVLAVSGHFHANGGFNPNFDWVSVNLSWGGKAPGPPTPGPYTVCGTPPSGAPGPACTGNDEVFKQNLLPAPAYNGPYKVNATAKASDQLTGSTDTKSTNEIDF